MNESTIHGAKLRDLLSLAWPIVISRSAQVVVGVTDAVMVAHLGEAALAAVSAGAGNSFTAMILPLGTVFIVSSFSAQLTGAGDVRAARRYGWYGLGVALLAQVFGLVAIALLPAVIGVLPFTPEVRALMTAYMSVRLLSSGAAVGLEALANYYGGTGDTVRPMIANVTAMVLNVLGIWLLVDGRWGLPRLGAPGTALASTLATTTAFVLLLAEFIRQGRRLPPASGQGESASEPAISWVGEFLRMIRFGLPAGFNWFFEFMAFQVFINLIVAQLGTTSLAAMMIVLNLNSISFMPAFGIASAGAILVGQAIGSGAHRESGPPDRVWMAVRLTLLTNIVWQGLVGVLYIVAPQVLLGPFVVHASPDLPHVARRMLVVSAAWQLSDAIATTFAEALRAAGDTTFTLWARCAMAWVVFVPGAWISVRYLGGRETVAVAWLIAYLSMLAVLLVLRWRSGVWRNLQLVQMPASKMDAGAPAATPLGSTGTQ